LRAGGVRGKIRRIHAAISPRAFGVVGDREKATGCLPCVSDWRKPLFRGPVASVQRRLNVASDIQPGFDGD